MGWTLITGAAQGLGREIALHLSKEGYSIVIHYHTSEDEAKSLCEECNKHSKAEIIQGDLRNPEPFLEEYLARFSQTDHVVHNVGNFISRKSIDTTDEEWRDLFVTNVHAPFVINQALLPRLKRIVSIGVAGLHRVRSVSYSTAYTASKAALLSYTRSLAGELAANGTTVNMVSPGVLENSVDLPSYVSLPMGRPGRLSEVSRTVSFLLHRDSGYITGQNIEVAGGLSL